MLEINDEAGIAIWDARDDAVMRILTVSDRVEPALYGPHIRERTGKIDLILGCGDLPNYYLEYIVSLLDAPLYFVHGNHDRVVPDSALQQERHIPRYHVWGENLHGRTVNYRGLLLAGLEGCRLYNPHQPFQYSEAQVMQQVLWLGLRLYLNRILYGRHLDIFITHAPARGIHDGKDLPHQGFDSYLKLLRTFRPLLMIHGHQHVYNRNEVTETDYEQTRVINTYGYRILELAPRPHRRGWRLLDGR